MKRFMSSKHYWHFRRSTWKIYTCFSILFRSTAERQRLVKLTSSHFSPVPKPIRPALAATTTTAAATATSTTKAAVTATTTAATTKATLVIFNHHQRTSRLPGDQDTIPRAWLQKWNAVWSERQTGTQFLFASYFDSLVIRVFFSSLSRSSIRIFFGGREKCS